MSQCITEATRPSVVRGIDSNARRKAKSPLFAGFGFAIRLRSWSEPFDFWLVAGAGFEPATFGL
jgi:hypothetical protein